ncbi:MAG: DUF5916 domain-containing protein [Saprospiraceae bacterium]
MLKNILFLVLLVNVNWMSAQVDSPFVRIHKAKEVIKLDGLFNESDWRIAQISNNFKMCYPIDTVYSAWKTEARITFDNNNLYFAITCFENKADYIVQSLKRDFESGSTDVINITLDPFRDGLNGLIFSVSPFNVQREGSISEGNDFDLLWDNKWYSKVVNYEDHWDVEIAIPFKSLRYKLADNNHTNIWSINFIRTKLKNFETNVWAPVPAIYHPANLAFTGSLIWEDAPPKPAMNLSFIPYITTTFSKDIHRDEQFTYLNSTNYLKKAFGADAKIAINSSLNLDLTINPDFSQVDVDAQVANISRFELFFPETRQFFIENKDLFGKFGFPQTRPFFSRRLGLANNPLTGENSQIHILSGARLSGKINNKLRVGILNTITEKKKWSNENITPGASVSVLTLQQRIFARSTISAILVDKENFVKKLSKIQSVNIQSFNRIAGLEYNLFTKDNKWEGESYYHYSFSPVSEFKGSSYAAYINYHSKKIEFNLGHVSVDSTYTAEAGFVPRVGVKQFFPGISYNFWAKPNSKIRKYNLGISNDFSFNTQWKVLDYRINPYFTTEFNDQSYLLIGTTIDYVYLYNEFDPTGGLINFGESKLPIGKYETSGIRFEAGTGNSYNMQGYLTLNLSEYFKGSQLNISGRLAYRLQPIGLFSISYDYYRIKQEKPFPSANFFLLGPRAEISFRRDLFLSTFLQYNTQSNNFNVNARLQWRFAPVSDVFLVYTNNSFAQSITPNINSFSNKDSALVLKAVYWLNL